MTDLRKTRKSQQEKGELFQRFGRWILGLSSLCLIAVISIKGVDWFGGAVGASWLLFLGGAFILFIWKGGQWCEEKVAGTRALLFLVIIFFLPFIASIIIALFPPDPLPAAHITALLNVKFIGSALGLIFGFLLFAQRLDVMNRQAETANRQAKTAQEQVNLAQEQFDLAQRQHEAENRRDAYELLASEKIAMRVNGITILGELAQKRPEEWHIRIVNLLADFIRERSLTDEYSPVKEFWKLISTEEKDKKEVDEKWQKLGLLKIKKAPVDIEEAMGVIACNLTDVQKAVVQKHLKTIPYWPDLSESWLCRIKLTGAYLPQAKLQDSFLSYARLIKSDLTGAEFRQSHLDRVIFSDTALQDAMFFWANLTYANFKEATGLENYKDEPEEDLGDSGIFESYYIEDGEPPILPDGIKEPHPTNIAHYWNTIRILHTMNPSTAWRIVDVRVGGKKKQKEGEG